MSQNFEGKALEKKASSTIMFGGKPFSKSLVFHFFRVVAICVGFSLLVSLLAQASLPLPWTLVPITGQTLGVLLTGMILGPRLGFWAMLLYLAEGAVGFPVFAGGAGGFAYLIGPTGGYLLSYPLAAAFAGWGVTKFPSHWEKWLVGIGASVIIYALGVVVLGVYLWSWEMTLLANVSKLLWAGVLPFLVGDLIKLFICLQVLERFRS